MVVRSASAPTCEERTKSVPQQTSASVNPLLPTPVAQVRVEETVVLDVEGNIAVPPQSAASRSVFSEVDEAERCRAEKRPCVPFPIRSIPVFPSSRGIGATPICPDAHEEISEEGRWVIIL
ncbi:hypothetical protein Droror1_Dr00009011 [Drosera rotundifolia]